MKNAFYFPVSHNATFGERLTALRQDKGIKSVQALAEAIYEKFDKYEKSDSVDINIGTIESIRKRIASHLKENCNPKMEFIKEYCDFFGCDAGFLLGYMDFPTQKSQNLYELTGLNDKALDTLASWHTYQENMKKEYQQQTHFPIEVLNILLANRFETEFLLNSIQDLLKSDYKIPAYHNGEFVKANINEKYNKCLTPQYVVPNSEYDMIKGKNGFSDMYLLTLVKDKSKTWDNTQIALNDDFFESIALKTIEKHLLEIKKDFQDKESDD